MAAAAREAITEPTGNAHPTAPTQQAPVTHGGLFVPPGRVLHYPPPQPPGAPPTPPPGPPPPWSPPPSMPPPVPSRPSRKPLVLDRGDAGVVLLVAAGVFAAVQLTRHDKPTATGPPHRTTRRRPPPRTSTALTAPTSGPAPISKTSRSPNAPASTASWAVRSTCGAGGCVATAANINEGGIALVSTLTFDQLGGTWVAVGLASAQCAAGPHPTRSGSSTPCNRTPTAHSAASPSGPPPTAPAPPSAP